MRHTYRNAIALLLAGGGFAIGASGQSATVPRRAATPAKPLDIYIVDTEGGKATLFVTPSGETVLVDTGNPVSRCPARPDHHVPRCGVGQP